MAECERTEECGYIGNRRVAGSYFIPKVMDLVQ